MCYNANIDIPYIYYLEDDDMSGTTCCFIGHREIYETEALKLNIKSIIEQLIISDNIDTFLFGSKSCFNDLCYDVVTELQSKYPHIKRIYVTGVGLRDKMPKKANFCGLMC